MIVVISLLGLKINPRVTEEGVEMSLRGCEEFPAANLHWHQPLKLLFALISALSPTNPRGWCIHWIKVKVHWICLNHQWAVDKKSADAPKYLICELSSVWWTTQESLCITDRRRCRHFNTCIQQFWNKTGKKWKLDYCRHPMIPL